MKHWMMFVASTFLCFFASKASATGSMWFPFTSSRPVTCDIGCYDGHEGKDYGCPDGTNLYSPISGTVTRVENSVSGQVCDHPNYGNYIEITGTTIKVKMAHLKKGSIPWEVNDNVSAGDLVGKASNTGYTFTKDPVTRDYVCGQGGAYHLHMETRYKVKNVWVLANPDNYNGSSLWTSPLTYPSGNSNPSVPVPPSVSYAAGWSSQKPFVIEMKPNETATFTVKYTNLGNSTWKSSGYSLNDADYVELRACDSEGTVQNSWMYPGNDWINIQRVGKANETTIPANNIANFSFAVKVPSNKPLGTYKQYFRLYHTTAGYMSTPRGNYDGYYVLVHVLSDPPAPQTAFGVMLRNPLTAQWWVRPSNGSAFVYPTGANWPPDLWLSGWAAEGQYTFTPHIGDLNGDGYDDLVVERSDCNWYVAWNNRNGSFTGQGSPILAPWGAAPSPGKYFFWFVNMNSDQKDELLTYDASNGNWYVSFFNTSSNTFDSYSLWTTWGAGIGTFQPLVGDWNGDGKKDVCLRNWNTGQHWVRLSTGTGFSQPNPDNWATWGATGDPATFTPLVGDWNGDGKDDLLLYNPGTGDWWVRTSTGFAFAFPSGSNTPADKWQGAWTGSGYLPFVGDFNDDGKTDIGLRDPVNGNHWVRTSTGLAFSQPSPDNWQAAWGASFSFQLLTGRFGNGGAGAGQYSLYQPRGEDRPPQPPAVTFRLWAAPNPTSGSAVINFTLPQADRVSISIYDLGGRIVAQLSEQRFEPGQHSFVWDRSNRERQRSPSGMYFIRFMSHLRTATSKVVLID